MILLDILFKIVVVLTIFTGILVIFTYGILPALLEWDQRRFMRDVLKDVPMEMRIEWATKIQNMIDELEDRSKIGNETEDK